MSTSNLVIMAIKFFGLLILINQVYSSDYSAVLSRLYQRAAASNRPLIVVIDSSFLQSDRKNDHRLGNILNKIGYKGSSYKGGLVDSLIEKKKKPQYTHLFRPHKPYNSEKRLHHALLPIQKKVDNKEKEILRSPIIRNLLRISNNLRCQARDECQNQCNDKFTGPKVDKCVNTCDNKFDCSEPADESSGCDDCDEGSCGGDDCSQTVTGSTKGYASTEPPNKCKQC